MQAAAPANMQPTDRDYPPFLLPSAICDRINSADAAARNNRDPTPHLDDISAIVAVHSSRCLNWCQDSISNEHGVMYTVLHYACADPSRAEVIRRLLRLRARPDVCNSRGEDALTFAVRQSRHGHVAVATLLEEGVHPLKQTPLLIEPGTCTQQEHPSGRITYVLGPDHETRLPHTNGKAISNAFNAKAPIGNTAKWNNRDLTCHAFMRECHHVNSDELRFRRGKCTHKIHDRDASIQDPTLLFMLLRKGCTNSVGFMLNHFYQNADPNRGRDMFGNTPMHYAVAFNRISVVLVMCRNGADMLRLSGGRDPPPHPRARPKDFTRLIVTTPVTPVNLLALPLTNKHYLRHLSLVDRRQLSKHQRNVALTFRSTIIPMWLLHVKPRDTQQPRPLSWIQIARLHRPALPFTRKARWPLPTCWNDTDSIEVIHRKALKQWNRQCRFRGSAFHGWHRLPREVVRIIIGHIVPKFFHPLALDARLQRYEQAYHRGVDARRRRIADFYNTVRSTRLLRYTEDWHSGRA